MVGTAFLLYNYFQGGHLLTIGMMIFILNGIIKYFSQLLSYIQQLYCTKYVIAESK